MSPQLDIECLVVGAGPAGLAAAGALALGGLQVAICGGSSAAAPSAPVDTRTAALFPPVIAMLQRLAAWDELLEACAPLRAIRICDDTGRLMRAPEIMFDAATVGLPDLGWNVPNAALTRALEAATRRLGVVFLEEGPVSEIVAGTDVVAVRTASGRRIEARLVVGADGRQSLARRAAGLSDQRWTYNQSAIAACFSHSRPHRGISTELHRPAGPLTTVPLPGLASSLVWVEQPDVAQHLASLDDSAFLTVLAERLNGLLGDLSNVGPRRCFPLTGLKSDRMGRNRVALVGEAAHVLPPIGAQGLNLGMFDAAVLADLVASAKRDGDDLGGARLLDAYDEARATDLAVRQGTVDIFNRTLTAGLLPLDLLRGAGLHMLASSRDLRRGLMQRGLSPPSPVPPLMQPLAHDEPSANDLRAAAS